MAAQFMKAPYQKFKTLPSKQKGAVLLVSVVTLSLLALAGLSTVEQTVVQERTSVNAKASDDATRNADKGLKQAVADLTNGDVFTSGFCTENLSTEDPANWECEKVSEDGYTYVVSYIMNGDQPATDDNGDTIYKVSVVGVRSGSSGGSLATQSLTAGVVIRSGSSAGVWDDAIVGCEAIKLTGGNYGDDGYNIVGNLRNTNENAIIWFQDNGLVTGDIFYTDEFYPDDANEPGAFGNRFSIDGSFEQVATSLCDPLSIDAMFAGHLSVMESNTANLSDYDKDDNRTISSSQSYEEFDYEDKTLTIQGETTLLIQDHFDIKEGATLFIKGDDSVVNIYVGSPKEGSGNGLDGDVEIKNSTLKVQGTLNLYVADTFRMQNTEVQIVGNSAAINIFVGSPVGAGYRGDIEFMEAYFQQGSGKQEERYISVYSLFGESDNDGRCGGGSDDTVSIDSTWSSHNKKGFGARVYAPRSTVCLGTDFRGSIRGYDVFIKNEGTQMNYSVPESLQSQGDQESADASFALVFYTRGDVDFVAGGETACEQTGVAGSSSSSTSGGSGEASVNCDAIDDSSSEENSESAVSEQSPPVEESEVSEEAPASEESEVSEEAPASEESEVSGGSSGGEESEASEEAPASEESEVSEESEESSTSNYPDGYADLPQACQDSYNSGTQKITICHVQGGGKKRTSNTLEISVNGWNGHSNHNDDYCGPCN